MTEFTDSFLMETRPGSVGASARLTTTLRELYDKAKTTWPGVTLSEARYAKHLGSVVPDVATQAPDGAPQATPDGNGTADEESGSDAIVAALGGVHTDDLYLACACAYGDANAIRCFERKIIPRAEAAIRRVDATPQFVSEVAADLRVRLLVSPAATAAPDAPDTADAPSDLPRIARYLGSGPLAHWVQVAAMRLAQSRKRQSKRRPAAMELSQVVESLLGDDPALVPFVDQLREPFAKVFEESLRELTARERNVLRLYLIDGVSAEAIGRMYNVHRATVARWITKARETVHASTKRKLQKAVRLDHTSFESVVGLMWSGLDLSLATWFGR